MRRVVDDHIVGGLTTLNYRINYLASRLAGMVDYAYGSQKSCNNNVLKDTHSPRKAVGTHAGIPASQYRRGKRNLGRWQ